MKKIEAIIRKSVYTDVKDALDAIGVNFITYWDVTGIGNEKVGHVYRGIATSTEDIQRRYIAFVCNDEFVEPSINAIIKAAQTGEVGDGKIFVSDILEAVRIRTGERGGQSLK